MKKLLPAITFFSVMTCFSQQGLYRHFPQPVPQGGMYSIGNPQTPLPTSDGGYLLINWRWVMGFESPGGLHSGYTIKTDSNFVPQWRKNYPGAVTLPTGGIILFHGNTIEKVTASGTQVWIKHLTTPVFLNDAVVYGNKIRFVGNLKSYTMLPATTLMLYTSDGFSLLADTSGNYINNSLFHSSVINTVSFSNYTYRGSAEFSKIKRDSQGNFFVYSNAYSMSGLGTNMSIAKFDTSFSFIWARSGGNSNRINDIDILPNGRIIASGVTPGNTNLYWESRAALLKMDGQGNLVAQCFFENRSLGKGLAKKTNGNYVVSVSRNDSLFMLETDTSLNVSWFKHVARGSAIGGSVIRNNHIFTPLQYGHDLVLISNDLNGNSCASYSISYTRPTSTITLVNFTLTPVTYSAAIVGGTTNSIFSQSYIDSCKCPVFIPLLQNNLCVGNTGTIAVIGTGNLSWYGSATGSSFIQAGSQFTFSSNSPTTLTVYAQDSACTANPIRTPVVINVHAIPSLSFSPPNPVICYGHQIFLYAIGATNYTWSHNLPDSPVQNLNPLSSTVYTVTGSVAQGCSDTKTVALSVVPAPTITTSSSGTICSGQTATISAGGGSTYYWSNGQTSASFTVSPSAGYYNYNVAGSNGVCNAYSSASILVLATPSISVVSDPAIVCLGGSASITASGANNYQWSNGWSGAGLLVSPSSNTTYVITGSSGGCQSSASITIPVQSLPGVVCSSSASMACVGAPVSFSASGAGSYSWSNGAVTSSFSLHTLAGLTTYSVTGSDGTCTASSQISVLGVPPPAVIASSDPTAACVGSTATISATGAGSYSWSNGSTNPSFTLSLLVPGKYNFNVLGSDGFCTSNAQVTLISVPVPVVSIASTSGSLCAGNPATLTASGANSYSWNNGWTGQSQVVTPSVSSTYLIIGTSDICSDSAGIFIPVQTNPAVVVNAISNTVCTGTPVNLTASGANTYTWNTGFNGSVLSFNTPAGLSSYSVVGSAGNCSASAMLNMHGVPTPTISITSSPALLCGGAGVTIAASGAHSYTWGNAATTNTIHIIPFAPINMSIYGADGSCGTLKVFSLNVLPGPTLNIVADRPAMCYGESFTMQASGADSYTWSTGGNAASVVLSPLGTTSYTLSGINQYGCINSTTHIQVVNLCIGMDEQAELMQPLQIYPNPNNGSFIIKVPALQKNSIALVSGVDGKLLLSLPLNNETTHADISHLAKGIYLLRIAGTGFVAKIIRE
jgi:hypothetical protein